MKLIFGLLVVLAAIGMTAAGVLASTKDASSLSYFADGSRAGGSSVLTRDGERGTVTARINATHLEPGAAYTYWYVIFNMPQNCSGGECGEDDLFLGPDDPNFAQIDAAKIAVIGGNGKIVNKGGHATFTGGLFEGSPGTLDVVIGPGGLIDAGPGMLMVGKALTAEIHIVVRNHGPAQSGADLAEQLTRFWGNCDEVPVDDDPQVTCVDEQFAVHTP